MGVVYKTTNLLNGKWYIGKDEKNNPNYLGSGVLLTCAIKKYGRENFKKEIIAVCDTGREELANLEKKIIEQTNAVSDTDSYNIAAGGIGGHTWYPDVRSDAHRDKISKALTGKKVGPKSIEARKKLKISRRLRNPQYKIIHIETGDYIIIDSLSDFVNLYGVAGKTIRYSIKTGKSVRRIFVAYRLDERTENKEHFAEYTHNSIVESLKTRFHTDETKALFRLQRNKNYGDT